MKIILIYLLYLFFVIPSADAQFFSIFSNKYEKMSYDELVTFLYERKTPLYQDRLNASIELVNFNFEFNDLDILEHNIKHSVLTRKEERLAIILDYTKNGEMYEEIGKIELKAFSALLNKILHSSFDKSSDCEIKIVKESSDSITVEIFKNNKTLEYTIKSVGVIFKLLDGTLTVGLHNSENRVHNTRIGSLIINSIENQAPLATVRKETISLELNERPYANDGGTSWCSFE